MNNIQLYEPKELDHPTPTRFDPSPIYEAIEQSELAIRTKKKYKREIEKLTAAQVDIYNPMELKVYSNTLSRSSKSFLKAALGRVISQQITTIKAGMNASNLAGSLAYIGRLEAVLESIEIKAEKGSKTHTWLTAEELSQLVRLPDETEKGQRDKLALLLLGDCGLRRDEAIRAKFSDIKSQGSVFVLAVDGKGSKKRTVPLAEHTKNAIDCFFDLVGGARILKGFDKWGNRSESMGEKTLYDLVGKYGLKIGKSGLAPHDLRRTFARIRYDAGMDIGQIQILLGHASRKTTERYLGIEIDLEVTSKSYIDIM